MRTYGELETSVVYIDQTVLQVNRPPVVGGGSGSNVIYRLWDGESITLLERTINSNSLLPQVIEDEDNIFEPRIDISGHFNTVLVELYFTSSVEQGENLDFSLSLERKINNEDWNYTGDTTFISGKKNSNYIKFLDVHGIEEEVSIYYRFRNSSIEDELGNHSIIFWAGYTAYCKLEEY